jgi:hypothetical protein
VNYNAVDPPSLEATAAAGLDEADEAGDAAGVGRESSGTSAERDKEKQHMSEMDVVNHAHRWPLRRRLSDINGPVRPLAIQI